MAQQRTERSYRVAAVEKALRVLDVFAIPPHRFVLTEISDRTGLSTNQVFRLLHTLVEAGFVQQRRDTKCYSLGPRVFGLTRALFHGDEVLLAAREILQWAHDKTGETIALIVPDGESGSVVIDVRESEHPLLVAATIGTRSEELHAGAVGKLILAYRADAAIERYLTTHLPLQQHTRWTPTSVGAIWAEVEAIREQGYAVSDQEVAEGMYGLAAPIFDRRGTFVAAITLSAPVSRAGAEELRRHRVVMVEAGRRVSMNLGFRTDQAFG